MSLQKWMKSLFHRHDWRYTDSVMLGKGGVTRTPTAVIYHGRRRVDFFRCASCGKETDHVWLPQKYRDQVNVLLKGEGMVTEKPSPRPRPRRDGGKG